MQLAFLLANWNILIVHTANELSGCTTAQEVEDIPNPDQNDLIGFDLYIVKIRFIVIKLVIRPL